MADCAQRLQNMLSNIATLEAQSHRVPGSVRLLAVSKAQPLDKIQALYAAGQRDFGENYLQEALSKISALRDKNIIWHFIGRIQSKKCEDIARNFAWVHSVSRLKEAQKLNEYRDPSTPLNICIQVNVEQSEQKAGVHMHDLEDFVKQIQALPHLKLRGLMTVPDPHDDLEQQRVPFHQLFKLYQTLQSQGYPLDTLSMGMSQDYAAAIREGSTLIRIGTALFGPRSYDQGDS